MKVCGYEIHPESFAGREYIELLVKNGLIERRVLTAQEREKYREDFKNGTPLPDDIYAFEAGGTVYVCGLKSKSENMTMDEVDRLIQFRKAKDIHNIMNWVSFFGIMSVIGAIGWIIIACTH